jgi:uncharacterized protein (DUF433 family)
MHEPQYLWERFFIFADVPNLFPGSCSTSCPMASFVSVISAFRPTGGPLGSLFHHLRRGCSITKTFDEATQTMIDRITVNPKIHFGKPCIEGTRITVQSVLELLNEGLTFDAIIHDYYPDLRVDDIRACLQYAIALVSAEDIHLSQTTP